MARVKGTTRSPARTWLAAVLVVAIAAAVFLVVRSRMGEAPEEDTAPAAGPAMSRHIYSETADPRAAIAAALAKARAEHKRVIVDFGGDWCGDCQVLDLYLHEPPNAEILAQNYELVHVWIGGHIDRNLDIPEGYGIPIHKGVPALAVLAPDGNVIYAQQGEFEDMRALDAGSVTEFLNKWKS